MQYDFEWDTKKAKLNKIEHKISFEYAATIFKDPNAITIYDTEHNRGEDRWVTIGLAVNGLIVVMHHTFKQIDNDNAVIRIISSRKAARNELKQYLRK